MGRSCGSKKLTILGDYASTTSVPEEWALPILAVVSLLVEAVLANDSVKRARAPCSSRYEDERSALRDGVGRRRRGRRRLTDRRCGVGWNECADHNFTRAYVMWATLDVGAGWRGGIGGMEPARALFDATRCANVCWKLLAMMSKSNESVHFSSSSVYYYIL